MAEPATDTRGGCRRTATTKSWLCHIRIGHWDRIERGCWVGGQGDICLVLAVAIVAFGLIVRCENAARRIGSVTSPW